MIKLMKENDDKWILWNTISLKCADIVKINEHNAIFKKRPKYRVDIE